MVHVTGQRVRRRRRSDEHPNQRVPARRRVVGLDDDHHRTQTGELASSGHRRSEIQARPMPRCAEDLLGWANHLPPRFTSVMLKRVPDAFPSERNVDLAEPCYRRLIGRSRQVQ